MKTINKIWNFLSKNLFEAIGVLGLATMLIIAFGNVINRYFFHQSWAFTEELDCALFILISLLGAALAVRDGKAMGIGILTDLLPKKAKPFVTMFQSVATAVFAYLLFTNGMTMIKNEMRLNMKTAALGWPEAIFGSFVPIGGVALLIGSVCLFIKGIKEIQALRREKGAAK